MAKEKQRERPASPAAAANRRAAASCAGLASRLAAGEPGPRLAGDRRRRSPLSALAVRAGFSIFTPPSSQLRPPARSGVCRIRQGNTPNRGKSPPAARRTPRSATPITAAPITFWAPSRCTTPTSKSIRPSGSCSTWSPPAIWKRPAAAACRRRAKRTASGCWAGPCTTPAATPASISILREALEGQPEENAHIHALLADCYLNLQPPQAGRGPGAQSAVSRIGRPVAARTDAGRLAEAAFCWPKTTQPRRTAAISQIASDVASYPEAVILQGRYPAEDAASRQRRGPASSRWQWRDMQDQLRKLAGRDGGLPRWQRRRSC